jgi:SAM-dependent methyltransferase
MMVEDAARGRILDIGCGSSFQENVADVARLATQIDGVDPGEGVNQHPSLTLRWRGPFESAPISAAVYDMAFAYNVVEHIERARPFFEKVREILKPGGVFWALTPNSRHLFCKLSRAMEIVGVKWFMARRSPGINNYSAYYRLNSPSRIDRAIDGLGFASAQYFFTDAPGWEKGYLPPGTRWIGRAFDSTLASRINDRKLILAYRLTAPG